MLVLALPALVPIPGPFGMIFGSALAIVAVCNRKRVAVASVICAELQTSRTDFRNSPAICRPDCQKDRAHHEAGALEGSDRSSAALSHGGPCFRACSRDRASHPVRQHRSVVAVCMITIGLIERDGLMVLIGLLLTLMAMLVTAALLLGALALVPTT